MSPCGDYAIYRLDGLHVGRRFVLVDEYRSAMPEHVGARSTVDDCKKLWSEQ